MDRKRFVKYAKGELDDVFNNREPPHIKLHHRYSWPGWILRRTEWSCKSVARGFRDRWNDAKSRELRNIWRSLQLFNCSKFGPKCVTTRFQPKFDSRAPNEYRWKVAFTKCHCKKQVCAIALMLSSINLCSKQYLKLAHFLNLRSTDIHISTIIAECYSLPITQHDSTDRWKRS